MHIAIITGGISTERIVALRSAENMKNWIEISGHSCEVFDFPSDIHKFLERYQSSHIARHFPTKQFSKYTERHPDFDIVIPILHGRYGEDGTITGMCETLGIRVAGCVSVVHALCIDKFRTNCVVEKLGIKVPKTWVPGLPFPPKLLPDKEKIGPDTPLQRSLIIKPNQGGSSLATNKASTLAEYRSALESVQSVIASLTGESQQFITSGEGVIGRYFPSLEDVPMVQECIPGREFTVGVYQDATGYHVLPIIEIVTQDTFFDYTEKYETDGSNEVFFEGEDTLQDRLREESLQICAFIGTKGVVRIDWRYDGKDIYFLEVNTIPGFTNGSLVPKMWKKAGKTEKEFVEMLSM